jgi:hypothetical protein
MCLVASWSFKKLQGIESPRRVRLDALLLVGREKVGSKRPFRRVDPYGARSQT